MKSSSRFQFLLLLWMTLAVAKAQRPGRPIRECWNEGVFRYTRAYRQLVKNTKRWEELCESIEDLFVDAEEEVGAAEEAENADEVDCDALELYKEALQFLVDDFLEQVDAETAKLVDGHVKVCSEPCIDVLPKGLVKLIKDRYDEAIDAANELALGTLGKPGKVAEFYDRLSLLCDRIDALCKEGEDEDGED